MLAFTRCCLLIPILGPTAVCLLVSGIDPGFVDSFSLLLFLLFSIIGLVIWGVGAFAGLVVKRPIRFVERLGNPRFFVIVVISSIVVYLGLFFIAGWFNAKMPDDFSPKLIVLGVDGATWNLLDPWVQAGDLPHFQQLRDNGARGTLQSLEPMRSPSLWTSIATGLPTEKHGVTGFFSSRLDLQVPRVWDICLENKLKVGLFAWLVSWPPRDEFEFIIPSWMARTPETRPEDYACIQQLILEQGRWGGKANPWHAIWQCIRQGARLSSVEAVSWFYIHDWFGLSDEARLAMKMLSEAPLETDLFLTLLRRHSPQAATFSLYGTDKLAHRFWHYMDNKTFPDIDSGSRKKWGDVIHQYYMKTDRAIGRIIDSIPQDCNVILVSDHGFKADPAAPRQFFLDAGELLDVLNVRNYFHYSTIERHTILDPILQDDSLIEETVAKLNDIHFKDDEEEPVFLVEIDESGQIVLRANFSLTWNAESPLLTNEMIVMNGRSFPVDRFFFDRTFSGTHDPAGVVLVSGPAIEKGATIRETNLLDIAPTMLYLLDLPISRELPGRIIEEAIDPTYWQNHPPVYIDQFNPLPPIKNVESTIPEQYLEHLRSLDYAK